MSTATPSPAPREVFVTGGTSGIGAAIARAFAASGARVWASGATVGEVQAAQAQAQNAGIGFELLDVRDGQAVQARLGGLAGLDVLVNCAGVIQRQAELEPEAFARTVDINLNGTMRCCAAARAALAARAGCIVNTASMLSFFGAIAEAAERIRVNAVAPGCVSRPLTQALQDDPQRSAQILARTPLGRWGQPEDVAEPVLFLASPAARFITGVVLPVDGGYLIA